jgi:hypothetical protein
VLIPVLAVALPFGWRARAVFAVAALVPVVAWSLNASAPVSTGGGSSLFVGTFLPGDGTLNGTKRALKWPTLRANPRLRGLHARELPGDLVLDVVAARHPGIDRDAALRKEAWNNLRTYPREDPVAYAGMIAAKLPRLWLKVSPRGDGLRTTPMRLWHLAIVLAAFAGVLLTRDRTIIAALLAFTLFHLLVEALPRYALPAFGVLIAAGAAGWFARLAQPRTTAIVRAYSDPLRRASISAGPETESAPRIAPRSPASSSTTQLATPSPSAIAAKPTGPKSSGERG